MTLTYDDGGMTEAETQRLAFIVHRRFAGLDKPKNSSPANLHRETLT